MIRALIFTDLDGTLLDDRYDLVGAAMAMDRVFELGALVVPVSSKTHAEMMLLRAQQSVATPFVFENGAGIDWGDEKPWILSSSSNRNTCDWLMSGAVPGSAAQILWAGKIADHRSRHDINMSVVVA